LNSLSHNRLSNIHHKDNSYITGPRDASYITWKCYVYTRLDGVTKKAGFTDGAL